ncbi:SPW repeat domain-containing protein [Spirosoma oryzicola]|uniref:SPW repeat domain-containing protein n=1 Tax=Spirosoma oryzicola TaxID=2898794 RepID=UPI001E34A041|nr:SPW repeat protein [Spirosoma oryzicola]UHG94255.1 SPW repeat protein [Spirosoma oryzicola]
MFDFPQPPFRTSVVSTKGHAVLDYLVGTVMIGVPWLLGFSYDLRAMWPLATAGGLVLLLAVVTDYEGGLSKKLLMMLHLAFDRLIGSLLGASPWLLGFADRIFLPHLILGLLLLALGLLTERLPANKKTVRTK